jgi:hypothetical protein
LENTIRRQVFPQAPSPTTTNFLRKGLDILVPGGQKKATTTDGRNNCIYRERKQHGVTWKEIALLTELKNQHPLAIVNTKLPKEQMKTIKKETI